MKKRIAIITFLYEVALQHKAQIELIFGDAVDISVYAFDSDPIESNIEADLAVVSIYPVYMAVEPYLDSETQVVIISTTISCKDYDRIMDLPQGERVLVVNYSREMTMETLTLFKHLGIDHITLLPYYPEMKNAPEASIAITPGEVQYVPSGIQRVIDVGNRVLASGTLIEIGIKIGMSHVIQSEQFIKNLESLKTYTAGMQEIMGRAYALEGELQSLLDILEDGIIAVNLHGVIHGMNNRGAEICGLTRAEAMEKNVLEMLNEIPFESVLTDGVPIKNKLIKLCEQNVRATVVPVKVAGHLKGALAMLGEFSKEERIQHELRLQLLDRGYRARYVFSDIVGESSEMKALKDIAARMARADGSILITGESGTGKELFAQAIHNASKRSSYQFVAVNCAAMPENLLESELFGYEEGAFTGAKKGGKPGLFELAHMGTLFLDEIGEMAPHLQSRLLRVLQEREVVRLGGDRVIKVDIRVISATNVELLSLVQTGRFRKDLYYRLNVLPLETLPLRGRAEDIPALVSAMQKSLDARLNLTDEAWTLLAQNKWEGNVRELRNVVEYMIYLDQPIIGVQDLRHLKLNMLRSPEGVEEQVRFESVLQAVSGEEVALKAVLGVLMKATLANERIGRRSLLENTDVIRAGVTESQCRRLLKVLSLQGMIKLLNGRGGTKLTPLGVEFGKYFGNRGVWG